MSKHTPGPWTAIKATYSDDRGTNDFWHVAYTDRGKTWSMKTAGDEGRANSYLIAAAPDLLAACMAMDENWHLIHDGIKRVFESHENPEFRRLFAIICEMQDSARSAISSAEGGAR